jgi:hypothetical protein
VERTFGDAPTKSGRRALYYAFLGFSLAPMATCCCPRKEKSRRERVLHAVHAGSISPAAGEIIALALMPSPHHNHCQEKTHCTRSIELDLQTRPIVSVNSNCPARCGS